MKGKSGAIAVLFLMAIMIHPGSVFSQTLTFQSISSSVIVDNLVSLPSTNPLDIVVSHVGTGTDYFITVSAGGAGIFDPRTVDNGFNNNKRIEAYYNIYAPGGSIAKDTTTALTAANVIAGTFATSAVEQTESVSFTAEFFEDQFVGADTLTDDVIVTLYEGVVTDIPNAVEHDTATVTISSTTGDLSELTLVPPGGTYAEGASSYTLDFDILETQETQAVDMLYRSNGAKGFTLSLSSANNGALKIEGGGNDSVPYTLTANGAVVSVGKNTNLERTRAPTTADYERYSLVFEIGTVDIFTMSQGTYSDVIVFEIAAR